MLDQPTAMHVARIKSSHTDKQGREREYESRLLRRTYRDGGRVRHETIANMSRMPGSVVDAVEAALKGEVLVPAGEAAVTVARSVPHGHVAAAWAMARKLGLPGLLGPAGRERDLALALVISRAVHPGSKLSTLAWWGDVTLGTDLGIADATTDEAYAAMDWLQGRQEAIEKKLACRHLAPEANPSRMALFDLSSSWLEGSHCPRLLPRRQEGQGPDRVRAAHRPRGPPGRDPGPGGERRRPGGLHRDRRGREEHLRA
jgi:hypothetical protein